MSKTCHNHVLSYLCSFAELRIILRSTAPSTKPENENKRPQYVLLQFEDISSEWHQQHGDRGDLYHHRCEWIWIWRWMTRSIYFLYPTPLSVLYKYNFSPAYSMCSLGTPWPWCCHLDLLLLRYRNTLLSNFSISFIFHAWVIFYLFAMFLVGFM